MKTPITAQLLALSIVSGCADPLTGTQGEVCATQHAAYEGTERPLVSPLTQVDTDVSIEPPPTAGCCLGGNRPSEDPLLWARQMSEGRDVAQLSPRAVKYPWSGACSTLDQCDTCNSCPYGIQRLQGTWIDFGQASDLELAYLPYGVATPAFGDESNYIEIDGNTFRWRTVNRVSGQRLDVQGYYYCARQPIPEGSSIGIFGVVYVPLAIKRFEGATCPLRHETRGADRSPTIPRPQWPEPGLGIGLPIDLGGAPTSHTGPNGQYELWPYLVEMNDAGERAYCHPGEYVGTAVPPDGASWSSTRFDCPEASVFLDCW